MATRLFDRDDVFGITRLWHYDESTDRATIETVSDAEPLIEANKYEHNAVDERARWGEWAKVASLPLSIFFDLKRRGIVDDVKKFAAWLNDRDNHVFRTRPGRV